MNWKPIRTAPRDGEWFVGRKGHLERPTQWGKTSHVPLYGWCFIASMNEGNADYDLWEPVEWRAMLSEEIIRMQRSLEWS